VQRALPPGLSARDAKILKSVQRRAHYLDKGFSILGLRFGWTFIIGLIPVVGDATDAALNYALVVRKARKADIPPWLLRRMLVNNVFSTGVGFVPIVGDLVLAMYKANSRNAALLEEFLRIRGEEFLRLQDGEGVVSSDEGVNGKKKKRKGVSKKDAEQIKPGAGMIKGELVPTPAATSTSAIVPKHKPSPAGSGSTGKKSFSFFGTGGKSKDKTNGKRKASPPGDMGRFVEDVSPTSRK
jgi:hypothetical protein